MSETELKKLLQRKTKAQKDNNAKNIVASCEELADFYCKQCKYDNAIEEYTDACARLERMSGNEIEVARMHRLAGEIYSTYLQDTPNALRHLTKYLDIVTKNNNLLEKQRAYATIGRTYFLSATVDSTCIRQEDLNCSKKAYFKSIEICEKLKNEVSKNERKDMIARVILNIGIIYEYEEQPDKAEKMFRNAINICQKYDIVDTLQQSYYTLAQLYIKQENVRDALFSLNKAIDIAKRLSTDREQKMCQILMSKADIYIETGNFKTAKETLVEAFKLKNPIKNEAELVVKNLKLVASISKNEKTLLAVSDTEYARKIRLYEKMGDCACELKNYKKAIEYYQKMLENTRLNNGSKKELSAAYVSLAQTYKDMKEYDLALEYFDKDLKLLLNNPEETVESYLNMAEVLELNSAPFNRIKDMYQKALDEARGMKDSKKKVEEKVITKYINTARKYDELILAEQLSIERINLGVVSSDSEESDSEIKSSGDVVDDIDIDDISGLSSDEETRVVQSSSRPGKYSRSKNAKGETPLHVACINGRKEQVRLLLRSGHEVNVRDNTGWTPLHEACNHGYQEIVEMLLDHGAAINDRGGTLCEGITPLHDACTNGHFEVVELLLDRGALPYIKNDKNHTALDILRELELKVRDDRRIFCQTLIQRMHNIFEKVGERSDLHLQETPKKHISNAVTRKSRITKQNSTPTPNKALCSSSDSDDEVLNSRKKLSTNPLLSSDDSSDESTKGGASEYKRAIENLRRKPFTLKKQNSSKSQKTPEKPNAYLCTQDTGDDWLENDLPGKSTRKRKSTTEVPITTKIQKTQRKNDQSSPKSNLKLRTINDDSSWDSDFEIPRKLSKSPLLSGTRHTTQTTLLNCGISRRVSNESIVSNHSLIHSTVSDNEQLTTNVSPIRTIPDSTTQSIIGTQSVSAVSAIDVHVQNKILRIPIPMRDVGQLTIGWLADETAKRYYKKEGIKPNLDLETPDNALLDKEDPLEIVLSYPKLFTNIISWDLPPVIERYMDYCKNTNISINLFVKEQLDAVQSKLSLSLTDIYLDHQQFVPVLKTIKHQYSLREINFSGTFFNDETTKILCDVLPTLPNLRSLNLSANCITWQSCYSLAEMFDKSSETLILPSLVDVNFSYNCLGDNSVKYLMKIFNRLDSLISIDLSSCYITEHFLKHLSHNDYFKIKDLERFNINENKLPGDSILYFFSIINPLTIKHIDLSGINYPGVAVALVSFFKITHPVQLETVNLTKCQVTDFEVKELLDHTKKSKNLKKLILSENKELTGVALTLLLNNELSLTELIIENCPNICTGFNSSALDLEIGQLRALKIKLEPSLQNVFKQYWKSLWKEKSQVFHGANNCFEFSVN